MNTNPSNFCLVFGEAAIKSLFRQITENVAKFGKRKKKKMSITAWAA